MEHPKLIDLGFYAIYTGGNAIYITKITVIKKRIRKTVRGGFIYIFIYFGLNSLAQLHRITLNGKRNFIFTDFLRIPKYAIYKPSLA